MIQADMVPSRLRSSGGWSLRRWVWVGVRVVGLSVVGYIGVQAVIANSAELGGATGYLKRVNPLWILGAVVVEALSYLASSLMQRRLLRVGGARIPLAQVAAINLAGAAINSCIPGGGPLAAAFSYRQLRRRGADHAVTTWTIVAVTTLTAVTLGGVALVGLAIAGADGPVGGLWPLLALLVIGPIIGVTALLRPKMIASVCVRVLRRSRRLVGHPRTEPNAFIAPLLARLEAVTPRPSDWASGAGFALTSWIADCGCLVAAFAAVGAVVPWRHLLVAYGAAQVATNVPITPGGVGVVEGSLTLALVTYGGPTEQTVAAVLLYRIISFWAGLPIGWLAWLGLRAHARRHPHDLSRAAS